MLGKAALKLNKVQKATVNFEYALSYYKNQKVTQMESKVYLKTKQLFDNLIQIKRDANKVEEASKYA